MAVLSTADIFAALSEHFSLSTPDPYASRLRAVIVVGHHFVGSPLVDRIADVAVYCAGVCVVTQ